MLLILYADLNIACSISCGNIYKNGTVSCENGSGPAGSMKGRGFFEEAEYTISS
jgi:hypothetical protein